MRILHAAFVAGELAIWIEPEGGKAGLAGIAPALSLDAKVVRRKAAEALIEVPVNERQDRVTELFDKYNLFALPVVDEEHRLAGVITVDDIISVLRQK